MSFQFGDGIANPQAPSITNDKQRQLEFYTVRVPKDGSHHTSQASRVRVDNLDTSLKAGARGPVTIADTVARERLQAFDRERIPERVVHARGAAAHGTFVLKKSLAQYTCAKVLTETSKETPMFVRFSTVLGSQGAAETAREVRGFSARFYTEQGHWDIVGNDVPVFFIQDGIKFADLIHSAKPEPQIALPQAQTAHDNFWDWMSRTPESAHMNMWILRDGSTIPRSYRMIPGYGVHTFVLYTAQGKRTFVKFHWKPQLGNHELVWDEALNLAGTDPDFLRRDLADAIEAGGYPKWDFGVQLVPEEKEHDFDFDLLDSTKYLPEDLVPIEWIGELTLNRNPTNYFAETEQVAFCTSNMPGGIAPSNDPLLAWRNFSYHDTQLHRLGANFNLLPINQALCPFLTMQRDGPHASQINAGPNYWPNRFEVPHPTQKDGQNYESNSLDHLFTVQEDALNYLPEKVEGVHARIRPAKFADHFTQATMFLNSMSAIERKHMIAAAQFELGRCDDKGVQMRMLERYNEIDHDFGQAVADNFGVKLEQKSKNHGRKFENNSNPISIHDKANVYGPSGHKIAIFALDGYDHTQVSALQTSLTGMGNIVMIIGSRKGKAIPRGVDEQSGVETNFTPELCRSTYFDAFFFPDGDEKYVKALQTGRMKHFAQQSYAHFKTIGAAGAGVTWLKEVALAGQPEVQSEAGALSYQDSNGIIMCSTLTNDETSLLGKLSRGVRDAVGFGPAFVNAFSKHRHYERDVGGIAA